MAPSEPRASWRRHIEAWSRSGLSQAEYCRRHGLQRKAFSRWKRRLEQEGGSVAGPEPSSSSGEEAAAVTEDVGLLRQAADDAARHVRTVYLFFLLFGFYIAVIVFSTTDEQLIRESPVTLPLLDVELPLVGFYAVIPWLFLLLHANLLTQLYLLWRKLLNLDRAIARARDGRCDTYRELLFPFLFSQLLVGRQHPWPMRAVFAGAVWVTTALLPLLLLLSLQLVFVTYHDYDVTRGHQAVVVLDLLMLWAAWAVFRGWTVPATFWTRLRQIYGWIARAAPAAAPRRRKSRQGVSRRLRAVRRGVSGGPVGQAGAYLEAPTGAASGGASGRAPHGLVVDRAARPARPAVVRARYSGGLGGADDRGTGDDARGCAAQRRARFEVGDNAGAGGALRRGTGRLPPRG